MGGRYVVRYLPRTQAIGRWRRPRFSICTLNKECVDNTADISVPVCFRCKVTVDQSTGQIGAHIVSRLDIIIEHILRVGDD